MTLTLLTIYLIGATITGLVCTVLEYTVGDVHLKFRLMAMVAWPFFWYKFITRMR